MKIRIIFILSSCFYLAACAHTPTFGDKMLGVSDESKQLGMQWNQGNTLIAKGNTMQYDGNKLIAKGEKQISEGKDNISKGKKMISNGKSSVSEGTKMMQASEANFNNKFPKTLDDSKS